MVDSGGSDVVLGVVEDGQCRKFGRTRMIKATEARFEQLGGLETGGKGLAVRSHRASRRELIKEPEPAV